MKRKKYEWKKGQTPPALDRHSLAKHNVLREYLKLYVSKLTVDPRREQLRLTLVDGFCGGGLYVGPQGERREGSPLIMLEAMAAAETVAKASRTKRFQLATEYFFVDDDKTACKHLQYVIDQSVHKGSQISILNGSFDTNLQPIIQRVKNQGTVHRCIFLLDQYGYKDTPLPLLRSIFRQLPHAEVLLTFATDSLIDYLGNNPQSQQRLDRLGFNLSVESVLAAKEQEPHRWRRLIQYELHEAIHKGSGAKHYTPFFIRSSEAHRSYWLIHLSNHHRARDVMTQLHWTYGNDFVHYGGAGLRMFGYDWQQSPEETGQPMLEGFGFDKEAESLTRQTLLEDVPRRLSESGNDGVAFDDFFAATTNETPATSDIMRKAIGDLAREGEVEVFSKTGALRRPGVIVGNSDRILIPRQTRLFPAR